MKITLFFIAMALFNICVKAQDYPIPAEGSEWNNSSTDLETIARAYGVDRIKCGEDTIINSKEYKALFLTWVASFIFDNSGINFRNEPREPNSYEGAVRTENEKVEFVPKDDTLSYIIYDFSLSIGDSVSWEMPHCNFEAKVFNIDSILIGDEYRKRITLNTNNYLGHDEWIEGIGSIYGIFSTYNQLNWEKVSFELLCYRDNEICYDREDCNTCDLLVLNTIDKKSDVDFKIYPNPVQNQAIVDIPQKKLPVYLRIYDVLGKLIFSKQFNSSMPIILDRSDLKQGLLIIEIRDKENNVYKKKILVN